MNEDVAESVSLLRGDIEKLVEVLKPRPPGRPTASAQKISKGAAIQQAFERLGLRFSYDEFRSEILLEGPGIPRHLLSDYDEIMIRTDLVNRGVTVYDSVVHDFIVMEAHRNRFHPVRTYLEELAWDGVPRLDTWLEKYLGVTDSPFVRKVAGATLIGAVRRIMQPGCKFDEALILVGAEGSGKSTAIRTLCPDSSWYSDSLPVNASPKHVIEGTKGIWIVESAELAGMKNIEHVKAFLSRSVDGPVRTAYARNSTSVPRQFIVIGTTNSWKPLPTDTGARRFWPVYAGTANFDTLERDRDQLWAEAVVREAAGEATFITFEHYEAARQVQEQFTTAHPWSEIIRDHIAKRVLKRVIPVGEVWEWIGVDTSRQTREQSQLLVDIMRQHRYIKEDKAQYVAELKTVCRVFTYLTPFDERGFDTSKSGEPVEEHHSEESHEEVAEESTPTLLEEAIEELESPPMAEEML
jgi:predicted P-loop ATPase